MVLGQIRIGDKGTTIQVVVNDTNTNDVSNPQDLTTATNVIITILDPNGNIVVNGVAVTIVNPPGVDGLVQYITSNSTSIWTISGWWRWYITYTLPGGTYSTNDALRYVLEQK